MDEFKPIELEIIPGINETEWEEIERKIELVLPFVKTIHIDLEDGVLINRKTFSDPKPFEKYASQVTLELHMMTDNPIQYIDAWAAAGFTRFIGHIEKMPDQVDFVAKTQLYGDAGLAVDGPTDISKITVPFDDLDTVLIYTSSQIGPSGPPFQDDRLEKVKAIREKTDDISETHQAVYFPIEVDGGINDQTILKARDAGASRFVSTSYLFGSENPEEQYHKLRKIIGLNQ